MRHVTTVVLAALLALVALSQRDLLLSIQRDHAVLLGHEADLRNLQAMARGERPVIKQPTHVDAQTPTPLAKEVPAAKCSETKTCAIQPDLIR